MEVVPFPTLPLPASSVYLGSHSNHTAEAAATKAVRDTYKTEKSLSGQPHCHVHLRQKHSRIQPLQLGPLWGSLSKSPRGSEGLGSCLK